jgi:hypothetical protein
MSLCLQGCAALTHLRLAFDEWALCNMQCLGAMKALHTLCLEAELVGSLECHALYDLGPHIRVLRLLGGAASQSFVETPDWKDFLLTLFDRLINLECFETTQDCRELVHAASMQGQQEEDEFYDGLMICKLWQLYVAVDRQSLMLRGVLRSKDSVGLMQSMCEE